MKKILTLSFVAAAVAMLGAQAQPSTMNAKEKANLQLVRNWWLECLEGRNLEATAKYQADSYIQHNINFPTGRAGFMKIFGERFKAAGGPITPAPTKFANPPVVQFAKGDFVVLVWERQGKDPVDPEKTYKLTPTTCCASKTGRSPSTGTTRSRRKARARGGAPDGIDYEKVKFDQTPQEQKNIEIATVEFKDILQHGHTELAEKVMAPTYIQHNPTVPTGRAVSWSSSAAGESLSRFRLAGRTSRR
jgi:predicted SnoaL-like aldol condensation-catalyzing enzyme